MNKNFSDDIGLNKLLEVKVERLKALLETSPEKESLGEYVYCNLRVTRLEKMFFMLVAKRYSKNRTSFLRHLIRLLMFRFPDLLKKAKKMVLNNEDKTAGEQ